MPFVDTQPGGLRVTVASLSRGGHVVTATGDLDAGAMPTLRRRLGPLADEHGAHVILDLSGTTFVDPSVLGVLAATAARLGEQEGELIVVGNDLRLRRLLDGDEQRIRIEPSLAEVVEKVVGDTTL